MIAAMLVLLVGCGGGKPDAAKKADAKQAAAEPDEDPPIDEKQEATFADPNVEPPPAPEGSIEIPDPWLYVHTCA